MLPILNDAGDNSKKYVVQFRGLNLGEGYQEGEFSDTENLSSALSPCLTQRFGRSEAGIYASPLALHAKDGLMAVHITDAEGGTAAAVYNGTTVGTVTAGRKQIATVGNYVVIFPDKVAYNVADGKFEQMEAEYAVTDVKDCGHFEEFVVWWDENLEEYRYRNGNGPEETFPGEVKVFDYGPRGYLWVPNEYTVSFASDSITSSKADAFPFKVGDGVTVSGCTAHPDNNKTAIIRGVEGNRLTFYENTFTEGNETVPVTIKREVPDLDYICESNYRLWGTKGNTIYGSKYGDPFNFQVFEGLTGDSYYIDVATDGEFTGCIPYSSHVCFFKENTLHKLYGSKPSNYQLVTSQVYGVQAGSERSMCIINETLLYKGVNGVYAYAGGVPELVSACFGTKRFSDACAASDGERYYISMRCGSDWHTFVYDVLRGLWLREDGTHCVDMAAHNGKVYLLSATGGLYCIDPEADLSELEWSATFCPFTETMNERKVYSRFHLRMEMAAGAWLMVEMRCDNEPKWRKVYTTHNEKARTVTVPVMPGRCDSVEIRLRGKGECLLRTFVREFQMGSDV